MLVAGSWTALTLGTGWAASGTGFVPSVRLEGDTVRFKGSLVTSAGVTGTITTPPTAFRPSGATAAFPWVYYTGTGYVASEGYITSAGVFAISASLASGEVFDLNSITYTLS